MEQTREETKDWQAKAADALENVGAGLALAAVVFVGVGVANLGESLWPVLWGGEFAGQAFWKFAHLDRVYHRFLGWDRAWWLIVIVPTLLVLAATTLGDLISWLRRSPEEKAEARRIAKESLRNLDQDAEREKELLRDGRRRAKEARKPMSGWRRLWMVLSLLLGLPVFAIAYSEGSTAYASVLPSDEVRQLEGQAFLNALFQQAESKSRSVRGCELQTVRMRPTYGGYYSVQCDRLVSAAMFDAFWLALIPAILMWIVGKTCRWVYRGFRPNEPSARPESGGN